MLETTARDQSLHQHPQSYFIPHVFMHWGKRQDLDIYELYAQWFFFCGILLSLPLSQLKYGVVWTR